MSGDPRVLAPLQQAYLAAKHEKVIQRLQFVWDFETRGKIVNSDADADSEIRAWTAPPAEPSLEQRVATIERSIKTMNDSVQSLDREHLQLDERIAALEQHPEPTAPDDPCGENCDGSCQKCEDRMFERIYGGDDAPAPQPAPDLDPVRVEAAAKASWEARMSMIEAAGVVIRAYLKDGGA